MLIYFLSFGMRLSVNFSVLICISIDLIIRFSDARVEIAKKMVKVHF